MYKFIDVTRMSEGISMPSEALKINGEYIERLVPGYRTLSVSGREALSPEITSYETGVRDGSILKSKRYPARTIRITYQLKTKNSEAFRACFNELARILNVENAQLVFNDEPDVYFIGTPSKIGEVTPGRNCVTGEFEILCHDPFKYSLREYEATVTKGLNRALVYYGGTYKSFPTLRAEFFNETEVSEDGETITPLTGNGDCGYVAFFNKNEKIIQVGDPEESDTEEAYPRSQTLVQSNFTETTSWGTAAKSLWSLNNGAASSSAFTQSGDFEIGIANSKIIENEPTVSPYPKVKLGQWSSFGSPTVTYTLWAQVTKREEKKAYIIVTINAVMGSKKSYLGKGIGIDATLTVDNYSHEINIKNELSNWSASNPNPPKVYTTTLSNLTVTLLTTGKTFTVLKLKTARSDSYAEGQAGVLSERSAVLDIDKYVSNEPVYNHSYHLKPKSYGTGGNNWVGPSITRKLPADASGEVGAVNCSCFFTHTMRASLAPSDYASQRGAFQALLVSGSGTSRKIVAGFQVYKGSTSPFKSNLRFYINGATAKTVTIDIAYATGKLNNTTSSIIKTGDTVTFSVGGKSYSFKDEAIATLAVTELTFIFAKHINAGYPPLERLGLSSVKFAKNNCTTWRQIPNKFGANDVVEADCKDGMIYHNGTPCPALGALGNDWEEFYLTPGMNEIGVAYSEWLTPEYAPKFKVKYREVFL